MKPTIGRKLWFWPNGTHIGVPAAAQLQSIDSAQAMDATVVLVHDEPRISVNLLVLDHVGSTWPIRSVTLRQDGEDKPTGMYCEWMPYQVAQAKKDEPVKTETDVAIETEIIAKGLTAPCVTPERIEEVIVAAEYHEFPDTTVTVCMLTLRNGAKVLGHNYGSIDPTRQDWARGRREARAMAVEKIWELEGYLLRNTLRQA